MDEPGAGGRDRTSLLLGLLALLSAVAVGFVLKVSSSITLPLAFSFFIALLLYPLQQRIADRLPAKLGWIGVAVAMLIFVGVLGVFGAAIWLSLDMVADSMPQYADRVDACWDRIIAWARSRNFPISGNIVQSQGVREGILSAFAVSVSSVWSILVELVLMFFLVLLMLLETGEWNRKTRNAFSPLAAAAVIDTVATVSLKLRRFILIRGVISLLSGIVAGLWLWVIGVDLVLLWGILTVFLNFVPYIGSIIAAILPSIFAFFQMGPGGGLIALAGLGVIDQVMGNYIDPKLEGRALRLSPIVVLFSILFWGWIWGVGGALIATPMTITIIISCAHVAALRPLAILLSRPDGVERFVRDNRPGPRRERSRGGTTRVP